MGRSSALECVPDMHEAVDAIPTTTETIKSIPGTVQSYWITDSGLRALPRVCDAGAEASLPQLLAFPSPVRKSLLFENTAVSSDVHWCVLCFQVADVTPQEVRCGSLLGLCFSELYLLSFSGAWWITQSSKVTPSHPSREDSCVGMALPKSVVASPAPGQWLLTQL